MAGTNRIDFCTNNGAGTYGPFIWKGGPAVLMAEATWGGGNVQLQIIDPHGTALNMGTTITANGVQNFAQLPTGQYKLVVTTATAVYAWLLSSPTYNQ